MGYLFILGYIAFVGLATFLMKVGLKTMTPYQMNFLMGIGMLITGIPALWLAQKSFTIPGKEIPMGLAIGVMMSIGSIFFVLSMNKLPASVASVLAATYVMVVILLSWIFLKESFDAIKILGIILTFAGALLLTYRS
jgi:drug/metabolite transporter (DMT)-like permease